MSVSSIIDSATGKIFPDLIPEPNADTLGEVLAVGNSALNPTTGLPQSATDFDNLGCISIETGKVYQGNNIDLQIGEAGDSLKILGATTKGSILVGNGVETKELPVGANNLYLKANSLATYGVEWAVAGGGGAGVSTVGAGTNIGISGTATNPIVNLSAPLTTTLNMGGVGLTDSASSTGSAGQYLTAGAGGTTLWATLPTSVASVSAGTNISLSGTATNPVVNLEAPLTSTLNVGSQTISSSTGSITIQPVSGQDINCNVDGAGRLHITQSGTGGATQPAISVENNNGNANGVEIDFYKNSSSPAVNDTLGIISFHGNSSTGVKTEYASIKATIADPNNGTQNGILSLSACINSATPSEFFRADGGVGMNKLYKYLDTNSNYITSSTTTQTIYQPNNGGAITLLNSGNSGSIALTANGTNSTINATSVTNQFYQSTNGSIILTTGGAVQVAQSGSTSTKLTTEIANVNYYPTFVVDNQNSNSISIPAPAIQGQRMTLINKGVLPASTGKDITSYSAGGIQTALRSSNGLVWIAPVASNMVYVYDETLTTLQATITFTYGGGTGAQVYCMLEDGGNMYFGGMFDAINYNAQAQVGMARASIYTYAEDLFYDGASGITGIQYGGVVYDIEAYGGLLYFGGNFISFSNGNACWNICSVFPNSSSSTYDWCNGGVDNKVYSLLGAGSYLFVGGDFQYVYYGVSATNYHNLATYTGGVGGTWDYTGGNNWNAGIQILQYTNLSYIFVGGDFTNTTQPYNCYIDYIAPNAIPTDTYLTISNPLTRNSAFYNGYTYISTQTNGIYFTNSFQVFTQDGTAQIGYTPSYVGYFNSKYVVAYTGYTYFMNKNVVSQDASFTLTSGQFKFNTTAYSTATISIRDVGWDFIGDLTSSPYTWRQTSYNPWGAYS